MRSLLEKLKRNAFFMHVLEKLYDIKEGTLNSWQLGFKYDRVSDIYGSRKKDVILVFYHGIGDVLYGLNFFIALKEYLKKENRLLIAAFDINQNNLSNSVALNYVQLFFQFDRVIRYVGSEARYWKSYNTIDIFHRLDRAKVLVLPFHYEDYACDFSREYNIFRHFKYPKKTSRSDAKQNFLRQSIQRERRVYQTDRDGLKTNLVIIHLETRSGNWSSSEVGDLLKSLERSAASMSLDINVIIIDGGLGSYNLVFPARKRTGKRTLVRLTKNSTRITSRPSSKSVEFIAQVKMRTSKFNNIDVTFIDPKRHSAEEICHIVSSAQLVCAVNSFLWPLTGLLGVPLLGVHYLDSPNGACFRAPNIVRMLTANRHVARSFGGCDAIEGVHYTRASDNRSIIEWRASYIVENILRVLNKLNLSDKLESVAI
jgi:hypothetical protein